MTGINKTMLNHVGNVVKNLSKKAKIKKNDYVLDIASNDGSLLKNYKKYKNFWYDPIQNTIMNIKILIIKLQIFFC